MPFSYERLIHFADTDAAGVVFFANYLALCHEAYEEALAAAGMDLSRVFADTGTIIPVTRSEVDYLRPLACGNRVRVTVTPAPVNDHAFTLNFTIVRLGPPDKNAARVRTEHMCIASKSRERTPLPPAIAAWVAAG